MTDAEVVRKYEALKNDARNVGYDLTISEGKFLLTKVRQRGAHVPPLSSANIADIEEALEDLFRFLT